MNWIKKIFKKEEYVEEQIIPKGIGDLEVHDDITIIENNESIDGWVIAKKGNIITIVYDKKGSPFSELTFHLTRPLNRTEICENGVILKTK